MVNEQHQAWDWFPLPRIRVFDSKKKAARYIKTITGFGYTSLNKAAQVNYYTGRDGAESIAVVTFNRKKLQGVSTSALFAIIAHECSHIIDSWLEDMGEDAPGGEVKAYALQACMLAVSEQLGEKWITETLHPKKPKKN